MKTSLTMMVLLIVLFTILLHCTTHALQQLSSSSIISKRHNVKAYTHLHMAVGKSNANKANSNTSTKTVKHTPIATTSATASASATSNNYFTSEAVVASLNELQGSISQKIPVEADEYKAMLLSDVSKADNFYETTLPTLKKHRISAANDRNIDKRVKADAAFLKLNKSGYNRRYYTEQGDDTTTTTATTTNTASQQSYVHKAAKYTEDILELTKTKEEQLTLLKKQKVSERNGIMKVIPSFLHKYIDYLSSCYQKPTTSELTKNMSLGTFFSLVVLANASARSAFMYLVVGNLILVSSLLTKGMPKYKINAGMEKKKPATWSKNSFNTAVSIVLLSTLSSSGIIASILSLFPSLITKNVIGKAAMCCSLLVSSYVASQFEVFEEKHKNGWRWAKALEGTLPSDVEARLQSEVYNRKKELVDLYDYTYDPQVDDYPIQPKFIDDIGVGNTDIKTGGSGEYDEVEATENYVKWKEWRKNARKPPVDDAPPETPWIGGKAGLYVNNLPSWLATAYKKNVLKANKWRDLPTKFVKDFTEFQPIEGPIGCRDKRPDWLDVFGTGVWEEKTNASRRAARSFGTYRKTMWKLDKKVVLLPCDGADKKGPGDDKK